MDKQRLDKYIAALKEKKVNQPCPRCRESVFDIVGDTVLLMGQTPNTMTLGGTSLPVVVIICAKCGYVTMHAQGSLDMRGDQ